MTQRTIATRSEDLELVGPSAASSSADLELYGRIHQYLLRQSQGDRIEPALLRTWEGFYQGLSAKLRLSLRKWGVKECDREDCLQEIWVAMIAALLGGEYDSVRSRLTTWLFKIAQNRAIDFLRRGGRRSPAPLSIGFDVPAHAGHEPDVACERLQTLSRLDEALKRLMAQVSPLTFRVFCLRAIEHRPSAEVAHTLGITPSQVRFRLHRAKRRIRALLHSGNIEDVAEKHHRVKRETRATNTKEVRILSCWI